MPDKPAEWFGVLIAVKTDILRINVRKLNEEEWQIDLYLCSLFVLPGTTAVINQ